MAIEKSEHKTPYFERQNPNMSTEFHSASNQWIIDVKCPFYEEFLTLFENEEYRGEDESKIKTFQYFFSVEYSIFSKNISTAIFASCISNI